MRRGRPAAGFLLAACASAALALDAEEIASRMPESTSAVLIIGDLSEAADSVRDFLGGCGAPLDEAALSESTLAPAILGIRGIEMAEAGINLGGPAVLLFDAEMDTTAALMELDDSGDFTDALDETDAEAGQIAGQRAFFFGGDEDHPPRIAATADHGTVISASGRTALRSILEEHGRPELAASVTLPGSGEALFLFDLNAIVQSHGRDIDRFLTMVRLLLAQSQRHSGVDAWSALMGLYADILRGGVCLASEVEVLSVTVHPSRQALEVIVDARLAEDSVALAALPRHASHELTLADRLPSGALLTVSGAFDAERTARMMAAFLAWFTATLPRTASSEGTFGEMTGESMAFYSGLGDEIAYAMYPAAEGGLMPATAMIMRASDPAVSHGHLLALLSSPATLTMMRSMYGTESSREIVFEDLGVQEVEGHDAHHVRFAGLGHMMRELLADEEETPETVRDVLTELDSIDHWIAAGDGMVVMTTESEARLMARILGGQGEEFGPPAVAASALDDVDYLVRLSLARLIDWATGLSGDQMPEAIRAAARRLARHETGLWASATMEDRGVRATLLLPSSDIREVVQALSTPLDGDSDGDSDSD